MNLLITGANRGLGYELAYEALQRGHSVIAGARNIEEDNGKLCSLVEEYKERVIIAKLDVTDEADIEALAARLRQEDRTLGAIINNAAILIGNNIPIESLELKDVQNTFEVNLYGPMMVVKHFLPLLTEPAAALINISSEAGSITNAYPNNYPYTISKTAMNMFSKQLKVSVKDRDIQVLSIHPGWIRTDMGGERATGDPRSSAIGIMDLIERKKAAESDFVDIYGKPMLI